MNFHSCETLILKRNYVTRIILIHYFIENNFIKELKGLYITFVISIVCIIFIQMIIINTQNLQSFYLRTLHQP